jgi:hypothetical protein
VIAARGQATAAVDDPGTKAGKKKRLPKAGR